MLALNYPMKPIWKNRDIREKVLLTFVIEIPYAVFFAIPFLQRIFKGWLRDGDWTNS